MGMYCIEKTYWIQTNDGQAGLPSITFTLVIFDLKQKHKNKV